MSWDIFVQDLPEKAQSVKDVPGDFQPAAHGRRSHIIAGILDVIPTADFLDPSWGLIDGEGWSIEVNLGDEEECQSFAFHIRGNSETVLSLIGAILDHLGFRALDSQTGDFFVAGDAARDSFQRWCEYRDHIKRG